MSKQDTIENEESSLLNDLIQQQHVSPIDNLDEISRLWPADDDPDLLLNLSIELKSWVAIVPKMYRMKLRNSSLHSEDDPFAFHYRPDDRNLLLR